MKHRLVFLLLIILSLCSGITGAASVIDKSGKIDSKTIQKLNQGKSHADVIVLLTGYKNYEGKIRSDKRADMAKSQASIRSKQDTVLKQLHPSHFSLKHKFENILGFSARLTPEGIQKLAALPDVAIIEEDEMVEAHLAQGIPLMHATAPRSLYSGTGVSIAVVDTGIDYNHPMLGGGSFPNGKVIGGYDFGDDDSNPLDCQGHGTSVAGIAAGTLAAGPGDYIGGVAHDAKLYALKIVSGCEGSAWDSDIVAAWDWAVTHKNDDPDNPILIINTSFGGGYYSSACDGSHQSVAAAANNAVANGITLFGSAGNSGYSNVIASPACLSNSISVGAVYDADVGSHAYSICNDSTTAADMITCYSNSAVILDILAPSHDAYTTTVNGGYTPAFGGTSAASPYAAGVGALVQSYARSVSGSYYSSADLKGRILKGDPKTDPRNNITKPRVNANYALYFSILKTTVPPAIDGDISEFADADSITLSPSTGGNTATVRALWDNDALYFAYEVTDTQLNASVTTRDGSVWNEDSVEWGIDTLHDDGGSGNNNSPFMLPDDYHGIINILNTQYDSQGTVTGSPTSSWNGSWQSAVQVNGTINNNTDTDNGYTVEVKIPWTTIGFSSAPSGDTLLRMGFLLNDKDASSYVNAMWPQGGGNAFENAANWREVLTANGLLFDYYCDDDSDTYVDASPDGTCIGTGCEPAGCRTTPGSDCNDNDASIRPYATEVCDEIDNDCDGGVDARDYRRGVCSGDIYVEPDDQCGGHTPCYATIQDGVAAAAWGATIKVAQGTYIGNISGGCGFFCWKIISNLEGGWSSDFSIRSNDPALTIIEGMISMWVDNEDGGFAISTIEGFTIRYGGISVWGDGTGLVTISNNIIHGNDIGIDAHTYRVGNRVVAVNNIVYGNDTGFYGVDEAYNNIIFGNEIGIEPWEGYYVNNTISNNSTGLQVSSMYANIDLINNIVWGNGTDIDTSNGGTVSASYSDIGSGTYNDDGTNVNVDPLFIDPSNGDYHLSSNSLLINQGDNRAISSIPTDFEGDTRRMYHTVDIGADEYAGPVTIGGEICDDEADNDGDGLIDCSDIECSGDLFCAKGELSITKTAGIYPVYEEDEFTYTLTVTYTNIQGPDYVTGVTVTDELPSNVTYISSSSSQGTCQFDNGIVICSLGTMNNGSSATIDITVTPPTAGSTVNNTASVTSDVSDPYSSNNSASISTFINFIRYVKEGSIDTGDCKNPASPCVTIQYAVNQSTAGDKIRVAQGTYHENIDLGGVASIIGGWNSDFSARTADPGLTIIDGDANGNVISSSITSGTLTIEGFTIRNGTFGLDLNAVSDSTVNIANNIISENSTGIDAYVYPGDPCSDNGDVRATLYISNNMVYGNNNNGIYGEAETRYCDWDYDYYSRGHLTINSINNTISGNNNGIDFNYDGMKVINLLNDIVWGNTVDLAERIDYFTNASYSDIGTGEYNDDGTNFNVDPVFIDPANGDYHLSSSSPLINQGNNSAPSLPTTDFEGDPRTINCSVDIGADEFQPGTGLWHEVADNSTPGGRLFTSTCTESWWYGQDSTGKYNTGSTNAGSLITQPYNISTANVLSFWSWEQTENSYGYDIRKVFISPDMGTTWQEIENLFGTENQWHKVVISLESYTGQTVMFKFSFDTVDELYNNYEGWYLDEIKVEECSNVYYRDFDGDSYGDPNNTIISCTFPPRGYVSNSSDCDDTNPSITSAVYWYPDSDGDSYGNPAVSVQQCTQPAEGWVTDNTDYNDNDANIYPGGPGVRIAGAIPAYHFTLQEAYNAAEDGDTIECQETTFTENFSVNINKSIILKGGYDEAFTINSGNTSLNGNITITNGTLTIENFIVQ